MREYGVTESMTQMTEETAPAITSRHRWQPDRWRQARAWWCRLLSLTRRSPRRLRLCESLPLGERRFVAVVEFEDFRFLLGGTSSSLVLLARLDSETNPASEYAATAQPAEEESR